jgi:hypothetical protein
VAPASYDRLGLNLFQNVRIDVGSAGDDRFLLDGWSEAEVSGDLTFRWALTRRSTLAFPLIGRRFTTPGDSPRMPDYVLRVHAEPLPVPGARQTLSVTVNGWRLGAQQLEADLREYEFPVPGRHLHRNINVVALEYGYARAPRELGGGGDDRLLSVRFDRIDFAQRSIR